MQQHLGKLCIRNDDLREFTYKVAGSDEFDVLWPIVEREYWETRWLMQTLNGLRIELGDFVEGADWDRHFLHAACVKAEHSFRWNLEMPPAFDEAIAREATTAYSVFTDIVIAGAADPLQEWLDYHQGIAIPLPGFGRTAG